MKRIVVVVVAVAVLTTVILPPVFGARARALMEERLSEVTSLLAQGFELDVAFGDWEAGWFSSTTTVTLSARFPGQGELANAVPDLPDEFSVTLPDAVTLVHGPIMLSWFSAGWGGIWFEIDESVVDELQAFQNELGIDYLARLAVLVGFFTDTTIRLDMPAFEYLGDLLGNRIELSFGGLETIATFDRKSLGLDGGTPRFSVGWPDGRIVVDKARWEGDLGYDDRLPNVPLGGANTEVARILFASRGSDAERIDLDGLSIGYENSLDGDHLINASGYRLRRLGIADFQIDDIRLDATARLNAAVFAELMNPFEDLATQDIEARQIAALESLAKTRAWITMDPVAFSHKGLPASASLALEYKGDELPANFALDEATDTALFLSVVDAQLDVSIHRDLLTTLGQDELDALVRVLVQEGIVREDGDTRSLDVDFEDKVLLVNGKPFEAFELVELLMGF